MPYVGQNGATWSLSAGACTFNSTNGASVNCTNPGFTVGQPVTFASLSGVTGISNATVYWVSAYPTPTTSSFGLSSSLTLAQNATSGNVATNNITVASTSGTGTCTASIANGEYTITGSSGFGYVSKPYACPQSGLVTGAYYYLPAAATATSFVIGMYSVVGSSATLIAQTALAGTAYSGLTVGAWNFVPYVSTASVAASSNYAFSIVPSNSYVSGAIQSGQTQYATNAGYNTPQADIYSGSYGSALLTSMALPGSSAVNSLEALIYASITSALPPGLLSSAQDLSFLGRH